MQQAAYRLACLCLPVLSRPSSGLAQLAQPVCSQVLRPMTSKLATTSAAAHPHSLRSQVMQLLSSSSSTGRTAAKAALAPQQVSTSFAGSLAVRSFSATHRVLQQKQQQCCTQAAAQYLAKSCQGIPRQHLPQSTVRSTSDVMSSAGPSRIELPGLALRVALSRQFSSTACTPCKAGAMADASARLAVRAALRVPQVARPRWDLRPVRRYYSYRSPGRDDMQVLYAVMAVNGVVFLAWQTDPELTRRHFTTSIQALREGRVYTLLTAGFSQASFSHLFANMIGLYFFGRDVALRFGARRFLALYAAGAVVGSLSHVAYYYYLAMKERHPWAREARLATAPACLGASAAVNALVVTSIMLNPTATVLLYGVLPMPAAALGVLFLATDILGLAGGPSGISHVGHLGGAATGAAFYFLMRRRGFLRRW